MSKPTVDYNVAIVDDHELFAKALEKLIKAYKFMHVKGIFSNGQMMIDHFERIQPDLIFMDILMPAMDGIEATSIITKKYPHTKVIAISMYDDGINVKRMLKAGAWGYITKDLTKKTFETIVTAIVENKRYISSSAAVNYTLYTNNSSKNQSLSEDNFALPYEVPKQISDINITPREKQIINYLAQGYSHKEIADAISRSARTVDTHKQNIMLKLNTHKSNEIVALALKHKLI